jgi:hypothetical protein
MPTLMQKIRLAFKGWSRRREEAERAFVARNAGWTPAEPPPARSPVGAARPPVADIDIDGLVVAFVDDSGVIAYYLDSATGEVLDVRDGATFAAPRYRRVPRRSEESDAADRRAFVESREKPSEALARAAASRDAFRRALGEDRSLERAWYSFKNDRVLRAVDDWLRREGLR